MDISIKKINGFTEQDLKNLNDNFQYIKMKILEDTQTTAVTETTTTTETTTNSIQPLSNEIELSDGNITIYATCNVKNEDGTVSVKKASYTLKPDGLYNYAGALILPIGGSNPLVYVRFL